MDVVKSFSRRNLLQILSIMILLALLINGALVYGLSYLSSMVTDLATVEAAPPQVTNFLDRFNEIKILVNIYAAPVSTAIFIVLGMILWLLGKGTLSRLIANAADAVKPEKKSPIDSETESDKRAKRHHERRLFIHLLSVLQREGRLLDFFAEDLSLYDDSQIGAAVRSIHENSKKVIEKYLAPKSVVEEDEGQEVTVEPGFDPASVKLTGNVTGEPPFKGMIRHRGWKARKMELPTLSGSQDSSIIAPAEIEIP